MVDDNLAFAPATELRRLIASRQVSPVELTELYYRRIERLDPHLNSYLTLTHDLAVKMAKKAEDAVLRGDELGPLHGIPLSVKDLQMTRGIRTTGGSLAFEDRVPKADCAVVERLRSAGAVILGKTNTSEFGFLAATENRLGDACHNPWNTERTSGGSSGGAASALAAGLCSLATGADGGGSIRIPAGFCGVYGIKPTQGRVSSYTGVSAPPAVNYLSQQGPMSRTVGDSALLLQVMAGHDPRDPGTLREHPPDFVAAADRGVEGLRIGWIPDFGDASVDREVAVVASKAAQVFEELGCSLEEATLVLDTPFAPWLTLFSTAAYLNYGNVLRDQPDRLTWYAHEVIGHGARVTGADYSKALGLRAEMKAQFAGLFEEHDLLLSPTTAVTAFGVGDYPGEIAGRRSYESPARGFLPFTHPINTVGYTAASVPCGLSPDGMPVGLHIIGRPGDEETVIAASAAFERAGPWTQRRPVVS